MAEDKNLKKKYIVKEGRFFGVERLPEGSEVELTEAEAASVLDLVEPADKPAKKTASTTEKKTETK